MSDPILKVTGLKMHFPVYKGVLKRQVASVKAVDGVSFSVDAGKTFGLVGESGSGKSTVGNCVLRRVKITEGSVVYKGRDLSEVSPSEMRSLRQDLQMITQDPYGSLDPRQTIYQVISEGIRIHGLLKSEKEIRDRVEELMDMVGLNPAFAVRFPHEFSGGQRQRIAIARALALDPSFIVCDEIVSALDVSIQSQIVMLMMELQKKQGLTYIFIGHDLSVVRYISDTVGVMYLGKLMELTDSDELYRNPLHPYTKALISAVPIPDPKVDRARERIVLRGEIPSPIHPPFGCNFCTRCPYADRRCTEEEPPFRDVGGGHFVACHRAGG